VFYIFFILFVCWHFYAPVYAFRVVEPFFSLIFFLCFFLVCFLFSLSQSYIYGSPYTLGAAAAQTPTAANLANAASGPFLPATQLSHAAAIAAATNQFYEYQVRFSFCCNFTKLIFI
jgi:hypothetical protein